MIVGSVGVHQCLGIRPGVIIEIKVCVTSLPLQSAMSRLIEKPNIAMSITSTGSQLSSTVVTGSAIADDTPAPAEDEDGHRSATGIQTPVASVEQNAKSTSGRFS